MVVLGYTYISSGNLCSSTYIAIDIIPYRGCQVVKQMVKKSYEKKCASVRRNLAAASFDLEFSEAHIQAQASILGDIDACRAF